VLHASAATGRTLVLAERAADHPQRCRADDCRDVMCVLAEESSAWMPNDPTGNKIVPVHRLISLRRARRVGVLPQAERSETLESPDP